MSIFRPTKNNVCKFNFDDKCSFELPLHEDVNTLIIGVCKRQQEEIKKLDISNPETVNLKEDLFSALKKYNCELSMHDFRVVKGNTHTNVIFDVVVPFDCKNAQTEIRKIVNDKLATYDKTYYAVIEFDTNFNG